MRSLISVAQPHPKLQRELSKTLGILPITAQLLINRGITDTASAERFLRADICDLYDPFSFSDMQKAVQLIRQTISKRKKIMVVGDYDVDGVTATALLLGVLSDLGAQVCYYIPHRIKDGYGLPKNITHIAKEKNAHLVITADCGTNAQEEIENLLKSGIDVIVTDHHEQNKEKLASPTVLLNPKVASCNYTFRQLAGVGVVFKLCHALIDKDVFSYLDLVALGTIADMVPLISENRIIAKEGLYVLERTQREGIKALLACCGITNKRITSDAINFILGPRINASGRIDKADIALELLMTEQPEDAQRLAQQLNQYNRQRQKLENQILEEAHALIEQQVNFSQDKVIVIAKEGWHIGLLGIVASKIADHFYRPAILISLENGSGRGSGRSIKKFHLYEGLHYCSKLLKNFGGHSHAVGMLIHQSDIEEFRQKINEFAKNTLEAEDLIPTLEVDMQLELSQLNPELVDQIEHLQPFGEGNLAPLFLTKGLKIKSLPRLYKRDTVKFWVTDGITTYSAVGFGMANLYDRIVEAESVDLVYRPLLDNWQGVKSVVLGVEEIFFH